MVDFFKDRNIGKYGKFVGNTKLNQRKLTSFLIGTADNKFQIVISTSRSRRIFIKLSDKLWHWKLQKVTGNSTLRTYEKFGNMLLDGLGRGGGGGLLLF